VTEKKFSKEELEKFLKESPKNISKKEIVRHFGLKGGARVLLKRFLQELFEKGLYKRNKKHTESPQPFRGRKESLTKISKNPADITIVEINEVLKDGTLLANPVLSTDEHPAKIILEPNRNTSPFELRVGQQFLVRLVKGEDLSLIGKVIRPVHQSKIQEGHLLGTVTFSPTGAAFLEPSSPKYFQNFLLDPDSVNNISEGSLVSAELLEKKESSKPGHLTPQARVLKVLGRYDDPRTFSLVAIHHYDIPTEFSKAALELAEKAEIPPLGNREDLRHIPLVTIDGEDARDFDDAVFAEPDLEDSHGWHLIVAIADVAHYVRPNDPLDQVAQDRGNSTYFPDRVVPMLPEALSNGLCSLNPLEDRACFAVHLWINEHGKVKRHRFVRALMRSQARLTYVQTQNIQDGFKDAIETVTPEIRQAIGNLYGAYHALLKARHKRGTLDLDLAERKVIINPQGHIEKIIPREQLPSHKLIEEFMIAANVAAAETLEKANHVAVYRVHDQPNMEKLQDVRKIAEALNIRWPKATTLMPHHLTQIIDDAILKGLGPVISTLLLRSQSQAVYSIENIGHYGLNLKHYCHFTSPIRRYADLLVHRALADALNLDKDPSSQDKRVLDLKATHISATERRSAAAEREALDRYLASYLKEKVGEIFKGKIVGVTPAGLFVSLEETGAEGLVPIASLKSDYYHYRESEFRLIGERTRRIYFLGQEMEIILTAADLLTGRLQFESVEEQALAKNKPKFFKKKRWR